jgi:hypothetical protein
MSSIDIILDDAPVNVDLEFPTIALALETSELVLPLISGQAAEVLLQSPVLEFSIQTPQLLFPITSPPSGAGGTGTFIWGETPAGIIDGSNRLYNAAHPYTPGFLGVYLNGLRMRSPSDYSEVGNTTFQFINAPLPGDSLSIDYMQG